MDPMHPTPPLPIDYEAIVQEVYEAVLRPGDTAVDVGAHVGRHTLPLARCVGRKGRVLAIEPLPMCREQLQARLKAELKSRADSVILLPHALSDRRGVGTFAVAEQNLPCSGLKTVTSPTPTTVQHIPVTIETLDELCRDLPSLRYIKLDTEGAELLILRGARATLARFRPVVGFEFGPMAAAYGVSAEDMAGFWQEQGYRVFAITGQELHAPAFRPAGAPFYWDHVAVPAEKRGLVRRVRHTLRRPRINWLAVHGWLQNAREHAEVGTRLPALRRVPWLLRPLAQACAWVILTGLRFVTIPQRFYNRALLAGLEQLVGDFQRWERQQRRIRRKPQRHAEERR